MTNKRTAMNEYEIKQIKAAMAALSKCIAILTYVVGKDIGEQRRQEIDALQTTLSGIYGNESDD